MKKLLLITMLLPALFATKAQVLIDLHLPQAGLNLKSQLWNMTLVNTGNAAIETKIDMVLSDAGSGQTILSANSRLFILPQGTTQLQLNNIVPIQYNILNSSFNIDGNPDGFLPPGVYSVCFSLLKQNGETLDKIAEECDIVEIEPAAPPFLNTPADEAQVEEHRPLFTWLPPSPLLLYSNLTYEFKLVEVLNNQNTSDAIQDNFPLFTQSYINAPLLQYPFSIAELDTAKLYAWQVRAFNNTLPAGSSEIFSFTIKTAKKDQQLSNGLYVKLKDPAEMPFAVCSGVLQYEYVNTYHDDTLQLELVDVTTNKNNTVTLPNPLQAVVYGQNFLSLDVSSIARNGHLYQLQVVNAAGQKQAIRFLYKKEN